MVTTVNINGLSTTITGLSPSTAYYYTIQAFNNTTPGPISVVQSNATASPARNAQFIEIAGQLLLINGKIAEY